MKSTWFSPRNKLLLLIILIGLAPIMAYLAWHYGASRLENIVKGQINLAAKYGTTLTCNQLSVRGFPFRIGLHCNKIAYDDSVRRIGFTAGALRTAAQIYDPGHIIAELDGPMQVNGKRFSADIMWDNLKASTVLDVEQISRFSAQADKVNIKILMPTSRTGWPFVPDMVFADRMEAHARQVGQNLDLAGGLVGLFVKDQNGKTLNPALQAELYLTIKDQAQALYYAAPEQTLTLKGAQIEIKTLKISAARGAEISLDGPISFTEAGQMNGMLSLKISNLNDLIAQFETYQQQIKSQIDQIRPFLSAFQPGGNNSDLEMRLTIRDGVIRAGFIPLGRIPAI